ncbi:Alpha/beta hydrolase family protein [Caprobacter fermentans]|uniref:Alpha/beta hydrolase family protein n=1 Tax=Caproicibacter fermentans TaxID=2576756 RepID=A0A6N8HZ83_9FIRM|nr:alpha/beta hydrolase [Caproicibacter fermentans]MVB10915.1 Alpha/beta hydrolase family protein [Caproicibacter fermentans]
MKFKELGQPEHPVVILLHGGGLSWWSVEGAARLLTDEYRVVMPIIDGHGEDGGMDFLSIRDSAEKLIRFIDRACGGRVFALCGLSLGGQIAAEALAERRDIADFAVLESVLVQPGHDRGGTVPEPLIRLSYGLIRFRFFAKLQAKALSLPDELFEPYFRDTQELTLNSLIHILKSNGDFHLPISLKDTGARVLILVGSGESAEMKLSAGLLKKAIPGSRLIISKGMRHGELSIAHCGEYVRLLRQWFSEPPDEEGGSST